MKFIFTTILALALYNSQAQFGGLNKIKEKAKDASSKDGSSGDDKKVDASKLDRSNPSNSPAKQSIYDFRSEISSAENAVNKNYTDIDERFTKIEKLLAKIKTDDPNWPEYEKDETRFKDLKAKYTSKAGSRKNFDILFDMYRAADQVKSRSIYDLLSPTTAELLSKKSLDDVKTYYNAHPEQANDNVKNNIAYLETFHAEKKPKLKKEVWDFIDNDFTKKTSEYLKVNRDKEDYIKKLGYGDYPDPHGDIEKINEGLKHSEQAMILFAGDAEITAQNKALKDAKADLEVYEKSDELKNDIELRKKMDFESILLKSPQMKDPAMDAVVQRDHNKKEWGTIKRISIISKSWGIQKNGAGIPLRKYIDVETCSTVDGKCYRVSGTIVQEYTGGGTYAKPTYASQSANEMNCANVNKNFEDLVK